MTKMRRDNIGRRYERGARTRPAGVRAPQVQLPSG